MITCICTPNNHNPSHTQSFIKVKNNFVYHPIVLDSFLFNNHCKKRWWKKLCWFWYKFQCMTWIIWADKPKKLFVLMINNVSSTSFTMCMVKASSSWINTMVTRLVNILAEEKEAILYNNDWKKRKYKIHVFSDLISFMNEGLLTH